MDPFKCYYCAWGTEQYEKAIDHTVNYHSKELLRYRLLILDEATGKFKYQTKTHAGVIPADHSNQQIYKKNPPYKFHDKQKDKRYCTCCCILFFLAMTQTTIFFFGGGHFSIISFRFNLLSTN